jgi:hypothetical protein
MVGATGVSESVLCGELERQKTQALYERAVASGSVEQDVEATITQGLRGGR